VTSLRQFGASAAADAPVVGFRRGENAGLVLRIPGNHLHGHDRLPGGARGPLAGEQARQPRFGFRRERSPDCAAAQERHLRRHTGYSCIERRRLNHDAAAIARAPDSDAPGVDAGQADAERDRVAEIRDILHRIDYQ